MTIEVHDLTFKYIGRRRPALNGVSFALERGEALLVLGPSGCGKSTLALCLNGAIPHFVEGAVHGTVRVGGLHTREALMAQLAQRVGLVFQDPEAQFCVLTVEEEVVFGLENLAVPRAEMDARIEQALTVADAGVALRPLRELLDRVPQTTAPGGVSDNTPIVLETIGLNHTYSGSVAPALRDVSVKIRPRRLRAVVGANGSGKSTLAQLCAGVSPGRHCTLRWWLSSQRVCSATFHGACWCAR
jgi:energy-coupling factor transporter ATP-binding protein EcfA2